MPRARSAPAGRTGGSTRKAGAAAKKSSSSGAKASTSRAKASTTRAKAASTSRSKSASSSRAKSSSSSRAKSSSSRSTASKRSAAAKKGGQARGRQQTAQKRAAQATAPLDFSGKSVAELRNALKGGVITPLNIVMLTRDRIEETLDDAVSRGRMTSADAQKLATDLLSRGRKQTNEVLRDLDKLLSSGGARKRGADAASRARKQVGAATARARAAADPVIAQADRARRTVGVGPTFPITGYDDLSVGQIQKRLGDLKPAELRKVRDYERRNANRKGVLSAIEAKL
jgi:polyhydroxyalkanoate synthesis regulator phasin